MTINLKKIIPFLDDEDLKDLIGKVLESENQEYNGVTVDNLLPFLDDEDVDQLLQKYSDDGKDYTRLLPFASDKKISSLFITRIEQHKSIKDLLPFVDDSALHELVIKLVQGEEIDINFDEILPFLEDEDIKLVFKYVMGKTK